MNELIGVTTRDHTVLGAGVATSLQLQIRGLGGSGQSPGSRESLLAVQTPASLKCTLRSLCRGVDGSVPLGDIRVSARVDDGSGPGNTASNPFGSLKVDQVNKEVRQNIIINLTWIMKITMARKMRVMSTLIKGPGPGGFSMVSGTSLGARVANCPP